jgi:hypothetical protein
MWQLNNEKNQYQLFLYPAEIGTAMGTVPSPQRADPFSLEHPTSVVNEIRVEMFEEWPLNIKNEEAENEFFRFRSEASRQGQNLQFKYSFETLNDRVPDSRRREVRQ